VDGVVDIEALRDHCARAQWDNWLKDLRTELYQILRETPIYPKNLYLERAPMKHAEYRNEVILKQIAQMHSRGVWAKPGR
jgi:beta-ureidopropionase